MPREFKLPDLGEGIHEGEIVDVLVSVGDSVEDGQPIMVIETDKATTEIPAPVTGVVKEIRVKPGEIVKVGQVLMTFTVEGERAEAGHEKIAREREEAAKAEPSEKKKPEKEGMGKAIKAKEAEAKPIEKEKPPEAPPTREGPVPAAPSTRRLARELGVDLAQVPPSGPGGRVTSEDVEAFAEKAKRPPEAPPKAPEAPLPVEEAVPTPVQAPPLPDFSQWGPVERVALRSVRKATAKHMALSWSQIPHVTHADVADITELEAFRRKHKAEIESQGGALSMTVFLLKASVAALKAFPMFNTSLDMEAEEIVLKRYYHVAVAVDTDRGLIVPVIRDVDRKSITELAKELQELAQRTRDGKIAREDLLGGTFTVTNIGALGGTGFTPIINYPQAAILGTGQARLQPTVRGDLDNYKIVPRLMLPLLLGFDHRIVDGANAARFLNLIRGALEKPEKLLMIS